MNLNSKLSQQLFFLMLLISVFLESCSTSMNLPSQGERSEGKHVTGRTEIVGFLHNLVKRPFKHKLYRHYARSLINIETQEATELGNFEVLPLELLQDILTYLTADHIKEVRGINRVFYKLTTGYDQPGLVGVENRPNPIINTAYWLINKEIDFIKKEKLSKITPETIPSFAFYQLMGRVTNLPQEFWPYLQGTHVHTLNFQNKNKHLGPGELTKLVQYLKGSTVHTLDLGENNLCEGGADALARHLQGSAVRTLHLYSNRIGDGGADALAQHLQDINVHTLNLYNNQIGIAGVTQLAQHLQGSTVHTLNLSHNRIGDEGATQLARHLQGSTVHTLLLFGCRIGIEGVTQLAQNLQGSTVHTLSLGYNQIYDAGVVTQLAQHLQGSTVHTLDLSRNQIGDEGATQLAQHLQESTLHTLDLQDNQIGDAGAIELAQHLQGSTLHTLDLRHNQIGDTGAIELAQHLQWSTVHTLNLQFNIHIGRAMNQLLNEEYPQIKACSGNSLLVENSDYSPHPLNFLLKRLPFKKNSN